MKKLFFVQLGMTLLTWPSFALETENRSLLPEGGHSPVEAGLESGRYREMTAKEWKAWVKHRESRDQREPANEEETSKTKARSDEPDFSAEH